MLSTTLRRLTTVSGLVCSVLLFTGCSSMAPLQEEFYGSGRQYNNFWDVLIGGSYPQLVNKMSEAEAEANIKSTLQPDEAVVVITRSGVAFRGAAISVISEGLEDPKYVGVTAGGVKLLYKTKAGTKYFFSTTVTGRTDAIKMELLPQKYYYINISATLDLVDFYIAFDDPAEITKKDIKTDLKMTEWIIANQNGFAFFERFYDYIKQQNAIAFDEWEKSGGTKVLKADQGYDTWLKAPKEQPSQP